MVVVIFFHSDYARDPITINRWTENGKKLVGGGGELGGGFKILD